MSVIDVIRVAGNGDRAARNLERAGARLGIPGLRGRKPSRLASVPVVVAVLVLGVVSPGVAAELSQLDVEVLVRGAPLHGADGMVFDTHDRLFVASLAGREIVVMDPRTGRVVDRFGPDAGVQAPDDVAVGPDGSLYWTDPLMGEVGRRKPDGSVTKQVVAPGMNPIAFSDDGRLFVAQAFFGDGLYELDPDLVAAPRVVIPDSGAPPFITQLNGMDFGPDGMLYAPQPFVGRVVRIDVDTGVVAPIADGLDFPAAVEFDADGNLHVAESDTGEIVRVDPATGQHAVVAQVPPGVDNMAFDSGDRLFASNFRNGAIHEIRPSKQPRTVSSPGLIVPGGVAVLPNSHAGESLHVADLWTLARFDGRSGRAEGVDRQSFVDGLTSPFTVAPDDANLVVTSWLQGAVQVWDPESDTVVERYEDFAAPLNAIRFQGDLVVAEWATGRVVRQDADTGERTTLTQGLVVPAGLAATDDDLWVGDRASGGVWRIVADSEVLASPALVAGGLVQPEGLAVDRDGSLLVVESGLGRLTRVDPATGATRPVASGLGLGAPAVPGTPPTWIFNGVAVGATGEIYVTGDIANVVYRLSAEDE
jgi:sugar lactone lactonase YvrE